MTITSEKSILIIAPSLLAESLSLKLTSLDNNLKISLDSNNDKFIPELIIWNILSYQSEDLSMIVFICLFLSLICQLGDLFISYFKRQAKVKDTGSLLPGHGGLLDRIDGIIFVLPAAYLIDKLL